jgi:hypothetical protein
MSAWVRRALALLAGAAAVIVAGDFVCEMLRGTQLVWNGARLAPTFGLRAGYSLYYGPDSGPPLSVIYTPLASLLYWPATLAATPNGAILTAEAIAGLLFFAPIFWIHAARGGADRTHNWLCAGLSGFLILHSTPIIVAFGVHGDEPAMGLCVAACLFLMSKESRARNVSLAAAAAFSALAVFTKQTFAPVIPALATFLLLVENPRRAVWYLAATAAAVAVCTLVLWCSLDLQYLVFNTITIPGSHPWFNNLGFFDVASLALDDFLSYAMWPAVAAVALVAAAGRGRFAGILRANDNFLLFWLALWLLPAAFLGRMKFGGALNNYAPALFPVFCGITLALSRFSEATPPGRIARRAVVILVLGFSLADCLFPVKAAARIRGLSSTPDQVAFEFAKKNPGAAYFPWYPLPTVMAEGKLYPFTYAVFDREIAGFKPEMPHIRACVPDTVRYLAYRPEDDRLMLRYFPEFKTPASLPDLPGWIVYAR